VRTEVGGWIDEEYMLSFSTRVTYGQRDDDLLYLLPADCSIKRWYDDICIVMQRAVHLRWQQGTIRLPVAPGTRLDDQGKEAREVVGQEWGVTELDLLRPEVGGLLTLGCCCLDRAVADDGRRGGIEQDLWSRWRD